MELTVNIPYSAWEYKISAVYKITFDSGMYYIGCSAHLRSRVSQWVSLFRCPDTGSEMGEQMLSEIRCNNGRLDIIELCSADEVKDKEAFYLNKYKEDTNMISKSTNAWNPVLQYSKLGSFIKRHPSIGSAARFNGGSISKIQDVINGIKSSYKGMVFILEKNYNERRNGIIKARNTPSYKKNGRAVVQLDIYGNEIARYKKIVEAARTLSIKVNNIRVVLNGRQKTSKGFMFKYSDE